MTRPFERPKTWILMRGLMRERRHWGEFPAQLQARLPDSQVVTLDLPGNGERNESDSPLSVSEMAAFCRDEAARQAWPCPYGLLAMSLGGMVAADWAAKHPQDLAAAVLINTSMRPYSPFYQRMKPRNYPTLLKLALMGGTPRQWEGAVMKLTTNQVVDPIDTLTSWLAYRQQSPVSRRNALRQLWAAARYEAPNTPPSTPTLVLTSAHDGLVDTRCSQSLAKAWGADLAEHPSAGHDLPLDDGPWVIERVTQWLEGT